MPRTSDESKSAVEQLLASVEVLYSEQQVDIMPTTQQLMDGLMETYLAAASLARSGAELKFYAQSVAVLRRLDRRLSALENIAKIGE